jgi:hypothetical protein
MQRHRGACGDTSPLHTGQGLARGLLLPVRPRVGADDPASGAHHPRPERRHRHVIGPRVSAQDRPVVALPTRHVERPHAVRAHIAERHRLDRFVDAPGCHPAIVGHPSAAKEDDTVLGPGRKKEKPRGDGAKNQFKASSMYISGRPWPTPGDYPASQGMPREGSPDSGLRDLAALPPNERALQ